MDVARKLKVRQDEVLHAVDTMTHPTKGMRYWWERSDENEIWVGVNFWPDRCGDRWADRWADNIWRPLVETSLWPPLGGQYFWCPSRWARKEGEGLVEYIQKWFVWERDCPSAEANGAWFATELAVNALQVDRMKCVTFHAGPEEECPSWIPRVDVRENVNGLLGCVDVRWVTGVDKRCLKHLMKQKQVAFVVHDVVRMVEDNAGENEFAVVCKHGKHRSVAVVMLVLALVYSNAVVGFHNNMVFKHAHRLLQSWEL